MNKTVLTLKLRNTTPLLVGWYDPYKQDRVGIRVPEIKGLWRWWCRAFIAGAMYDQGMLCGREDKNVYLLPRDEELKAISCFVGKILGLGYAGKEGAESSRFRLSVKDYMNIKIVDFRKNIKYQRIKLLTLKQKIEGIYPGCIFTLNVEKVREKYKDAEDLALKILIVFLQLSGIGKGGRRGLGSQDIIFVEPENILGNSGKDVKKLIGQTYEDSVKIVNKYIEAVNVECKTRIEGCKQSLNKRLPPLPVISRDRFKLFKVDSKDYRNLDFLYIHQFFVRTERCKVLQKRSICRDDLREKLRAWFLGLPRKQRGTGYEILVSGIVRRPSPIFIAYHGRDNVFGQGTLISVFLSGDWPKELEWKGGDDKPKIININENEIKEAYKVFINEFKGYLYRRGLKLEEIMWY
ncbi:MAG: hypothetical protein QXM82_03675 [Ignisphaera sp.]